jgi:hypothetical protein
MDVLVNACKKVLSKRNRLVRLASARKAGKSCANMYENYKLLTTRVSTVKKPLHDNTVRVLFCTKSVRLIELELCAILLRLRGALGIAR